MMGSQDDSTNLRLHRTPSLFSLSVWNVHEATLNDSHQTNNFCEGWNNKFSAWLAIIIFLSGKLSSGSSVKNPRYVPFFNRMQLATPRRSTRTRVRFASRGDSNPCARTVSIPEFLHGVRHTIRTTKCL